MTVYAGAWGTCGGMQGDRAVAFRSEILIKLDKKGRVLLPAAFRDELPADDRGAFVLYHSPNLPGVVNGNSRAGFAGVLGVGDGVMLVGKGDKFQLWNPGRWQTRRDSDRDKMAAFVRGLANSDSGRGDA